MDGAFQEVCATNLNEIRSLGDRVAQIEDSLSGLFVQMGALRETVENFMHRFLIERDATISS